MKKSGSGKFFRILKIGIGKTIIVFAFAFLLQFSGGCATIIVSGSGDLSPYAGVQGDLWVMSHGTTTREEFPKSAGLSGWTIFFLTMLFDLPLSAIADTVLLPVTIPVSLSKDY